MKDASNPIALTQSATTTLGSVCLTGITIGVTLAGTVTVKEGTKTIVSFAATTPPGDYLNIPQGVRYGSLSIVLSTTDTVAAFTTVA